MAARAPKKLASLTSPVKKKRVRSEEGQRAKRESDKRRSKTRITIGAAITKWQQVKKRYGIKTDPKMAFILLDSYLRTKSESRPERPSLGRTSSTETCFERGLATLTPMKRKPFQVTAPAGSSIGASSGTYSESVHYEYPFRSSPNEAERETCATPPVLSSENEKEPEKKDAACPRTKRQDEWTTTGQTEEDIDTQDDVDEEFSTSLSVGDGCYLVDLGSSSEFIVDEECILQLFRSCRECNRQCAVRKHVKGLKLVVYQTCGYCQNSCKWTNLPDDDDDEDNGNKDNTDFQINGKDTAHGQTNEASSNTS